MSVKVKSLLKQEKPREKALNNGFENLTETELISILIGSGSKELSAIDLSRNLLKKYGDLKNISQTKLAELTKNKGIGLSKAASIKAACEIGLRIRLGPLEQTNLKISKPKDVFDLVKKDLFGKEKEYLYLLCLNSRGKFIKKELVSIGTINESLLDPREIFKLSVQNNATSIILAHNHPSNDPQPSAEDILVTQQIYEIGKKIGVTLLDHIIVSDGEFISLKQLNLLNTSK